MHRIRVWGINLHAEQADPAGNAESIAGWIDAAAGTGGPDFMLFPEMSVSGYINNSEILREIRGSVESALDAIIRGSERIPDTVLLIGYPHFTQEKIFIRHSALRNGKLLFNYDKRILSPAEKKTFFAGTGESVVFPVDIRRSLEEKTDVRFGILLCYENHFPELAAEIADLGCEILFAPFAGPRETPRQKYRRMLRFLPARAYDNSCFVVFCNLIQDYPRTARSPGTAAVIDPKGRVIAKAVAGRERCVKAFLDMGEIERIRRSKMGYFRESKVPRI